jgi:hypothetical protein
MELEDLEDGHIVVVKGWDGNGGLASWLENIKFEVNHNKIYRELEILENSWLLTIVEVKGDVRNMPGGGSTSPF